MLVFDKFTGPAFDYVASCETVFVLGVNALKTIIAQKIPVPANLYHIYNLTFKGLVVCTSAMTVKQKQDIKQLVNFMGGHYSDKLKEDVTHLVTENVRSVKYEEAAKNNIKIMHPDWVTRAWSLSQKIEFTGNALDTQFDTYRLPIFFNLCFATSGLKIGDRNNIKALVEGLFCYISVHTFLKNSFLGHGGKFNLAFKTAEVDILILEPTFIGNEKHKAAVKYKKTVLSQEWVIDSVKEEFALSFEPYMQKLCKASTPEKDTTITSTRFNPDNTDLSEISVLASSALTLDETRLTPNPPQQTEPAYENILKKITLNAAKKAGNIFDGFSFYISGFAGDELNLLVKVLCACGAMKLDDINENITHVLLKENREDLFNSFATCDSNPSFLKLDWLLACLEQKLALDEADYQVARLTKPQVAVEPPSPASKRAMKSMSSSTFKKPAIPKCGLKDNKENHKDDEMEIISQYLEAPVPTPFLVSPMTPFDDESQFFKGKTIFLQLDPIEKEKMTSECEKFGAVTVDENYKKEVDFLVTGSGILANFKPHVKGFHNLVTTFWLEECFETATCADVKYHHKPLIRLEEVERPLRNEGIVVSNYKGRERLFISHLVSNLGGNFNEILKRSDNSIIICPRAEGQKYLSALKWNLAVLQVEWLLECYRCRYRVDETEFLIGKAVPSSRNMRGRCSVVPSSQEYPTNDELHRAQSLPIKIDNQQVDPTILGDKDDTLETPVHHQWRSDAHLDSPGTPDPEHNISRAIADFPTPHRQIAKAALLEFKNQNKESPRTRRLKALIDSPGVDVLAPSSPMPQLPECMREKIPECFGIRPHSSPAALEFHKRKLEGLDSNYIEIPKHKRFKINEKVS